MYLNGKCVTILPDRIKNSLEPCSWHDKHNMNNIPSDYTGFILNDIVYDNCRTCYLKTLYKWDTKYKNKQIKFEKFKTIMNNAIKSLSSLLSTLKQKDSNENEIKRITTILDTGIKIVKIHGNKIKRAVDEIESEKLKARLKNISKSQETVTKTLKTMNNILFNVIKDTQNYDFEYVTKLNFAWNNYKDTVYLFNNFTELFNNVKERIEEFDSIYDEIMEDLEQIEIMKVKDKRQVRHKTKYYIDEQGNKISLDVNVDQSILHK